MPHGSLNSLTSLLPPCLSCTVLQLLNCLKSLTLCEPLDCSPPGSSIHGISHARILEWVAISSSRGIFLTQGSNPRLLRLQHCQADSLPLSHQGSRSSRYWTHNHFQLRAIFLPQFLQSKCSVLGLFWWSSGQDSTLPMQGAWVPSLVGELDPTCCNEVLACHNQKRSHVQEQRSKTTHAKIKTNEVK